MNEKAFDIILEMARKTNQMNEKLDALILELDECPVDYEVCKMASDIQSINLHLQENIAMLMMPNHD